MRSLLWTVLTEVALPVGVFFGLSGLGVAAVWALVGSAGVSVVTLLIGWVRTRRVSVLGGLVGVQFVLGVVIALVSGDARFVLAKDYLITMLVAIGITATLWWQRPFLARIRRDLSPARPEFDDRWRRSAEFRAVHRRMTGWWAGGLAGQAAVCLLVIYSTPLAVAVVATNVITPAVLLALIAASEVRVRRVADDRPAAVRADPGARPPAGPR